MTTPPSEVTFTSLGHQLWGCSLRTPALCEGAVTFVLSHGLTNHHGDAPMFSALQEALLGEGHDVFVFDYFGSGNSEGSFEDKTLSELRQNLADAIRVAQAEARTGERSIALFGRSVGGSLSAFHARHPSVYTTILASAPFDLAAAFMPTYTDPGVDGWISLDARFRPSGQLRGEYRLRPAFYYELPALTQELADAVTGAQRVLVFQGGSDEKVETGQSKMLYERLAFPKEYRLLDGLGHNYAGAEGQVGQDVLDWIRRMRGTSLNDGAPGEEDV